MNLYSKQATVVFQSVRRYKPLIIRTWDSEIGGSGNDLKSCNLLHIQPGSQIHMIASIQNQGFTWRMICNEIWRVCWSVGLHCSSGLTILLTTFHSRVCHVESAGSGVIKVFRQLERI